MEGPPLGPGGEDITWPDQVAPRGRKASSTRKIQPQTSNHIMFKVYKGCHGPGGMISSAAHTSKLLVRGMQHRQMLYIGMPCGRWMPNLRPGRHCGRDGKTTGAGQSVQVRVQGRRQGNVCGLGEVNFATTARGEPLWVPLQRVDKQATAPTRPNPSRRYLRVVCKLRCGRHPPCRPSCYNIKEYVQ